jgi:hypothetical protein
MSTEREGDGSESEVTGMVPPAEGERRAASGYRGQYRAAAFLILKNLPYQLEWIRVADPEAGRVDDIQIASAGRVDAYQIKWSRYPRSFSLGDLISGSAPSLISQLADGWLRLKERHPTGSTVVHLLTSDPASIRQPLTTDGNPRHLAAFIEEVWKPARNSTEEWEVQQRWLDTWERIRSGSGLEPSEFLAFVRECDLEFGWQGPTSDSGDQNEQRLFEKDVEEISQLLFDLSASPEHVVQVTRTELIRRLGWQSRFSLTTEHSFPIERGSYEPIQATCDDLDVALDDLSSGYIAILGSPGSGKSTLLTDVVDRRVQDERVVRYYCFVPDQPVFLRGEAMSFLHDIVLQFDQMGVRCGSIPPVDDLQLLNRRFMEQLRSVGREWEESGRGTLIQWMVLIILVENRRRNDPCCRLCPLQNSYQKACIFCWVLRRNSWPECRPLLKLASSALVA